MLMINWSLLILNESQILHYVDYNIRKPHYFKRNKSKYFFKNILRITEKYFNRGIDINN